MSKIEDHNRRANVAMSADQAVKSEVSRVLRKCELSGLDLDDSVRLYRATSEAIGRAVERDVPPGKKLIWKVGRYKGRACEVDSAIWELDHLGNLVVMVTVKTRRLDGKRGFVGEEQFVDTNDSYHRQFRNLETCYEEPIL